MKLLEDNRGDNFHDIGLGNDFLDMTKSIGNSKRSNRLRINLKNTQAAPATQLQKNK